MTEGIQHFFQYVCGSPAGFRADELRSIRSKLQGMAARDRDKMIGARNSAVSAIVAAINGNFARPEEFCRANGNPDYNRIGAAVDAEIERQAEKIVADYDAFQAKRKARAA